MLPISDKQPILDNRAIPNVISYFRFNSKFYASYNLEA